MTGNFASKTLIRAAVSLALASAAVFLTTQPSTANSSPSVVELQRAISALEARVTALEGQLQRSKGNAQQAEQTAQTAPRPLLVSLSAGPTYTPMQLGRPAEEIRVQPSDLGWSGFYWGTSFGIGSASSESRNRNVDKSRQESTSVSSSTNVQNDGSLSPSNSANTNVSEQTSITNGASNGADQHNGALVDLYLGASRQLTPYIVAGLQVEGSLTQLNFDSMVSERTVNVSNSQSTDTFSSSGNNSTSEFTSTNSQVSNSIDPFVGLNQVKLDWMVSVIGRAGWLATPTTLLYGLAGWSHGHFEVANLQFGLGKIDEFESDGITVGGGVEKKLSPKWSLRAEYRYTNFGSESFSTQAQSSHPGSQSNSSQNANVSTFDGNSSSSSSSGTGTSTSTNTDSQTSTGHIENDLQVGRIGFTRYFTTGD